MNLPFFYEKFNDTDHISFSETSSHHALHVLRMKVGDELLITNGEGSLAKCKISHATKKECNVELIQSITSKPENRKPKLHIAISFTKNPARIEWFLEKATEIGIHSITPLITKRSEKIYIKRERFEKILISAMLQSQQSYLPKLNDASTLESVLQGNEELKFIAHCVEEAERNNLKDSLANPKNSIILIGPEGDFTKDEIHLCLQHNCKTVSLGSNRLRTETAGLFACVVFNSQIAEL
jgi:16S rRNA (uracil1498-N3)-methyltransferase